MGAKDPREFCFEDRQSLPQSGYTGDTQFLFSPMGGWLSEEIWPDKSVHILVVTSTACSATPRPCLDSACYGTMILFVCLFVFSF